jgi:DNA-binding NarL/FixJ family response regulator
MLAVDHDIIRRGIRTLLETRDNLQVVAEAPIPREAPASARDARPDIAILDYSIEQNGRDLVRQLKREHPCTEILIYTMRDREETIAEALQAGVRGFVLQSDTERHLFAAIDALSDHRPYFSGAVSDALLKQYLRSNPRTRVSTLTNREREVIQLIAEGKIYKQVARILDISIKTVDSHRHTAMQKLNLRTTAELVRYAVRNNIVEA